MAILISTGLYIILPWFYFTLLDSKLLNHGSTSLYLTLHYSTMAILISTGLYIILPWLYFTLLDSALLYHGCTSLYLIVCYCTMALLHCTWLNFTLLWFYFSLLDSHSSTMALLRSIACCFTLYYSAKALLHSISTLYYSTVALLDTILLYLSLLDSTLLYHVWNMVV